MTEETAAVSYLNESFYDITEEDDYAPFRYETDGTSQHIFFMGVHIWRDDEDERECDEEGNYEMLEPFLLKQARKVLAQLRKWEPQPKPLRDED
jgi:hypothetical protein